MQQKTPFLSLMMAIVTIKQKMSKTPCAQLDSFGFSHDISFSYRRVEYRIFSRG